jgi:predicted RNase H-like HicB family nuclease
MRYKIVLETSDEGFAASIRGLRGCHSQGATEQEAIDNISVAIREYLEVVNELSEEHLVREIEVEA